MGYHIIIFFILVGIELTYENLQNDLGLLCFYMFPRFSLMSSSLHPSASSRNLLQSGWCYVRAVRNARASWSRTCLHTLPWRNPAPYCAMPAFTQYATHTVGQVGGHAACRGLYMLHLRSILAAPYGVDREPLLAHFTDVETEVLFALLNLTDRCMLESVQILC